MEGLAAAQLATRCCWPSGIAVAVGATAFSDRAARLGSSIRGWEAELPGLDPYPGRAGAAIGPSARLRSSAAAASSTRAPPSAANGRIIGSLPTRLTSPGSAARTSPASPSSATSSFWNISGALVQTSTSRTQRPEPRFHLGPQPRHLAVHDPDGALERAGLAADPAPAREHDTKEGDDHDQIDAEHGQQRDNHAAMLASRESASITRKE